MSDWLYDAGQLLRFASEYWMQKCLKSMLLALCAVLCVLLLRMAFRTKSAVLNFYLLLLVLPTAFTGMSKLFYQGKLLYVQWATATLAKTQIGYVYFAVMLLVLAGRWLGRAKSERAIRALPQYTDAYLLTAAKETVAAGRMQRRYLDRVQVYISGNELSMGHIFGQTGTDGPFAGGVRKPYIVLPARCLTELSEEERFVILIHELIHLRSGHILLMRLYDLLLCWWWINPVMYLYRAVFAEDMELACDEECIAAAGIGEREYGHLLLTMIELSDSRTVPEAAFFARGRDFALMKKRIVALTRERGERAFLLAGGLTAEAYRRRLKRRQRLCKISCAAGAALVLAMIFATSYPRYTKMTELSLYDESLRCIAYDTEALRRAVTVQDGRLFVTEPKVFRQILDENNVTGDYVYLGFDTIMKTPGAGGGGDTGMINTADFNDIFYLAADNAANRTMIFLLKLM